MGAFKTKPNIFNPLKCRSISRELAVGLVVVVFLFQGLVLLAIYRKQVDYLHQELQSKADEYALNLSETLPIPIWNYDDAEIAMIGNGFARNKVVDSLNILTADGDVLFRFQRSADDSRRIERTFPIKHLGQEIGRAQLRLSMDAYRQNLAWFRNTIIVVLVISLVAIIVTTGTLLRVLMRTPLSILRKGIDRVAHGDYDYRFDEVHHSELAGIAHRFSDMASDIRDRERSLQMEVAERKRAEEKIRESETRLRATLDAIPDMIFQLDNNGMFVDFRGDASKLLLSQDEFIGHRIDSVMPSDIVQTFRKHLTQAFDSRQVRVFEYQLANDEMISYYECRLVAIADNMALAIVRDITEKVSAEAERNRLLDQLQRAHKMEVIGMLAGGVAHDLNNVLSGLVGYPELILLDLPADSPLRRKIEIMQKSAEKASKIVQDLLTLARRGVPVAEVVNLNTIIQEYLGSPEYGKLQLHHPNYELTVHLAKDLLNISGSPVHLFKTVMNLMSNSAEAVASGGKITIRTENRYIDAPIKGYDDIKEGDYVLFQISDNGAGISADDVHRIFEPFYTKKIMGRSGTGLGMAVVWGTVKDHSGYIDVQSTENEGTTVSIYLPSTRDLRLNDAAPETTANYMGRGERILIVDDTEEQREIASGMVARLGYNVECASSGEEAIEYVRRNHVDLLLLDMIMDPGIDGLETYQQIVKIKPGQRAIITSGFSESERVREAQSLGAGRYVRKPYHLETIARAVREELDR